MPSTSRHTTTPSSGRPRWAQRVPGPGDPLPAQIEQFLDWQRIQRNRPPTTVRAYRQDLAKFAAFAAVEAAGGGGDDVCSRLDGQLLRRYQVELAAVLPHPRTRARALVALRRFLGYAYDEGWTAGELSRRVTVPRYVVGDPHPVPTEKVARLLAALPRASLRDLRDRALIHLLMTTGCRISEALGLDRGDVRADGFRVLGKGGKHRTVYCTEETVAAVDDYLKARGPDPSPALFISVAHRDVPRGRAVRDNRLTDAGARRALAQLRRRMSADGSTFSLISDLRTPHGARHTAATTLLEATDGDVRLVQEVLGHATLETLRVYTEITDRRKREAYRRLGHHLRSAAPASLSGGRGATRSRGT